MRELAVRSPKDRLVRLRTEQRDHLLVRDPQAGHLAEFALCAEQQLDRGADELHGVADHRQSAGELRRSGAPGASRARRAAGGSVGDG